jgi:Acetyltransferase (GNAT) domain
MAEPIPQLKVIVNKPGVMIPSAVSRPKLHKVDSAKAARCDALTPTIFHEAWWLDAATGGNFDVVEVSLSGRVVGRLPFTVTKRYGMKMIRMPVITYFLGPAIDEGEGSLNTRFLKRLEITRELLGKLPRASWQYVKCHSGVSDVIAFQEAGFRTYVQFTHEIEPDPVDVLWQQLRNKTRNVIRKAEDEFSVCELSDPAEFLRLYHHNLRSREVDNGIDATLCKKIISASLERQRGRLLAVRDKNNQIAAANFCAWDDNSCFYLLSTRGDNSGNSPISLLLWEAIKESARRGLVFDFAGLGDKGSILFYSGFGASISARYVAVRSRVMARVVTELKLFLGPENFYY